jgi:hypothetical protein
MSAAITQKLSLVQQKASLIHKKHAKAILSYTKRVNENGKNQGWLTALESKPGYRSSVRRFKERFGPEIDPTD